ncbi:type II secretion system inner membrane protein GspF [Caulobacter sp. NIBR2454]|uniref:type II secretion system inner membrane protein GspF n=1 Tax=Caulobacter sp. NIBR2454 TaxID=3015996 RepID=UPI0022B623E3|nr:type II secretion system inner membrane protein GspF [Caulobacter sp. NIBR2454]
MAAFDYIAMDGRGRTRNGSVSAPDEADARRDLEARGLTPLKLTPSSGRQAAPASLFSPRLSGRDLSLITRQLATVTAVAPLEEALRTIALQAEKPIVRRTLLAVHAGVMEGQSLSEAMTRQGKGFPPLYRAMIAAGESSGALPSILDRLADLLERDQQARAKVVTAMVYPAMLALVAMVVVIALMTFVVPKVVDQFDSMGQSLPLLTRMVIAVSDLMRHWGLAILAILAVGGLVFTKALERPGFRLSVDRTILATPLIGRLIRDLHASQLARTLSTMVASGLPVLEGLTITAATVQNRVLRAATQDMATQIREGGSLSAAMKRVGVFPPILVYMTASGEGSGRLETMLSRASEYLEREFNTFTAMALSLLEPAIIVIMGALVALIVLSILLPILQINTLAAG